MRVEVFRKPMTSYYLILISGIALCFLSCKKSGKDFNHHLEDLQNNVFIEIAHFKGSHFEENHLLPLDAFKTGREINLNNVKISIKWAFIEDAEIANLYDLNLSINISQGSLDNSTIGFALQMNEWSPENYVLFPAAAYNGNRYQGKIKESGQIPCDVVPCGPNMDILLTDVPRLNYREGPSVIQLLSGDMSTPAFCYRSSVHEKGMILFTGQGTDIGDYSYKIVENSDRTKASLFIRMPGIREDSCFMGRRSFPSPDLPINFDEGDSLNLNFGVYFYDAKEIQDVFDHFAKIRKKKGDQHLKTRIPFSAAWKIQENKYNLQNWVEEYGYYSVGMRENPYQNWQTGWTGGMNAVYPLLLNGSEFTRNRALQTFDFLFDTLSPSGFFFDVFHEGEYLNRQDRALLRRVSDALFFIMKEFRLLEYIKPEYTIPQHWHEAVKTCADAYVELFEAYGHFGHWINNITGEMLCGPTASNGIAPGALALCGEYYNEDKYLDVAEQTGEYYYQNYVRKGITNAGPGDIWQCPDSESAFGLLESYVVLFELTGNKRWLNYAEEAAKQAATWVVSYNFDFPEESTFSKLGMQTTGTVIANVNNKHSSPGICSLSGNSLLKLYRYTDNDFYLELIRDIAKSIPQYMSRMDRPIPDIRPDQPLPMMPPGWINERVNMSDWEERGYPGDIRRGEIFCGSTWSEVANMLTYAEIPGIYIEPDKKRLTVFDHLNAKITSMDNAKIQVLIENDTDFNACTRIIIDSKRSRSKRIEHNWMLDAQEIFIHAHSEVTISFKL